MRDPHRTACLGVLLALLASLTALPAVAGTVTFHLVPEERWNLETMTEADRLPSGTVHLYHPGETEPAASVPLNQPATVEAGAWTWIAEAPGWVTVAAGTLRLTAEAPAETIVWPAVRACRVSLVRGPDDRGMQRVDVVSLDRGAVYPLVPEIHESFSVPAGRFLAYSVDNRGLRGISGVLTCRADENVALRAPGSPPRGRQQALVPVLVPALVPPDPGREIDRDELAITLEPSSPSLPRSPTPPQPVVAWSRGRGTLFYLDLPAQAAEVRLEHPQLRAATVELEARSGEAVELPPVNLRRRAALTVPVDYQPRREHRVAQLQLFDCGVRPVTGRRLDHQDCTPAAPPRPLQPGLQEYRFPDLDTGQYLLDARVDGEWVSGLGNAVQPFLAADQDRFEPQEAALLWEMEVWGEIRQDGEPVAGEVRLDARGLGGSPFRTFPTGADDLYHLYYFGTVADRFDLAAAGLPLDELERSPEERLGWYGMGFLQVCSDQGSCRSFHPSSVLIGSGRLDFDLGDERALVAVVTDAETRLPVSGAVVGFRPSPQALRFRDGEVWFDEAPDAAAGGTYTDDGGVARLRGLPEGPIRIGVQAEGYVTAGQQLEIPPGATVRTAIALRPDRNRQGARLVLPDGSPLASAAVLVFRGEGGWDRRCSAYADSRGRVAVSDTCREEGEVAILHPDAALTVLPVESLAPGVETEVARAPARPAVLRFSTEDGEPVADVSVMLGWDGVVLGPDTFLFATGRSGFPPPRTDANGRVVLRNVHPDGWNPPAAWLLGNPQAAVDLGSVRPGEVVEVTASQP